MNNYETALNERSEGVGPEVTGRREDPKGRIETVKLSMSFGLPVRHVNWRKLTCQEALDSIWMPPKHVLIGQRCTNNPTAVFG